MDLRWLSEPEAFEHSQGTLRIVAGPGTDWFTDPGGRPPSLNAPALAGPQEGPFRLAARVAVAFGATFDAGGLVVFGDERLWAKLCLERSPRSAPIRRRISATARDAADRAYRCEVELRATLRIVDRIAMPIARLMQPVAIFTSMSARS
jgi:regulation of enolase protein 1 (concanavalin A-like superfamily)